MSSGVHQKIDQAILEHKNSNFKKAEIIYKEILNSQPNNQDIYYYLGNLQVSLNDYHKAEWNFKKAIKIKKDFFQAYMNLANTLKELSKFEESEKIIDELLASEPNNLFFIDTKTDLLTQKGDYKSAIALLLKQQKIKPTSSVVNTNLANVYIENDQTEKAIPLLEDLIFLDKQDQLAYFLLTEAYKKNGNIKS